MVDFLGYSILLSPILPDRKLWSDFVFNHVNGNIFQTPEIVDFFSQSGNHEPVVVSCFSENGEMTGVMVAIIHKEGKGISGRLSARSIVMGGPLMADGYESRAIDLLMAYNKFIGEKVIYTQFRNLWDTSGISESFKNSGYSYEDHLNFLVDLTKPETHLWNEVQSRRRNEIRKAVKEGVTVQDISQAVQVGNVHLVLKEVYDRIKLPVPGPLFFEHAKKHLGPSGYYREFGAFYDNELIGVMIVLCFKGKIYNWYAGSHRKFYDKNPNDIIPWEIFRWGKQAGFSEFDFGGAGNPDKPYGVRDYKAKFGGTKVNFGRYQKVHQPLLMRIAKTGFYIWQKIK